MSTSTIGLYLRSVEIITPEEIEECHDMVLDAKRSKRCDIAIALDISSKWAQNVLSWSCYMRKLPTKLEPPLFTGILFGKSTTRLSCNSNCGCYLELTGKNQNHLLDRAKTNRGGHYASLLNRMKIVLINFHDLTTN